MSPGKEAGETLLAWQPRRKRTKLQGDKSKKDGRKDFLHTHCGSLAEVENACFLPIEGNVMSKDHHVVETTGSWRPSHLAPLTHEETEGHREEASSGSHKALMTSS